MDLDTNRLNSDMLEVKTAELSRLRNRHVAKLLTFLGEVPPYVESAIKRGFTMFSEDVERNIINSEQKESDNDYEKSKGG